MSDMDISIWYLDEEWYASAYYPGFLQKIARSKNYSEVVDAVVQFLQEKKLEHAAL